MSALLSNSVFSPAWNGALGGAHTVRGVSDDASQRTERVDNSMKFSGLASTTAVVNYTISGTTET